jgi:glutathione S-transferase
MRARLAVKISGVKVELREVLLRDKALELLLASPKATVPVLVDMDESILEESLDIMEWALEKNDPQSWLVPPNGSPDEMLLLIQSCEDEFKPRLDRYKYANRYDYVDEKYERNQASEFLWLLEQRLEEQNYLFGSRISLADMAIVTFVRQFANVDRQWFDDCKWQNLKRWLVEFLESEIFSQIMNKHQIWKAGDAITEFGGK